MKKLQDLALIESGSPQFRISAGPDTAPLYALYGQQEVESDLFGYSSQPDERKHIRTFDEVCTLSEGDVVFSLISGISAMVGKQHQGFLFTQNYIKIAPKSDLDSQYLVYLLNEDTSIKKQFLQGLQGSAILKYAVKQVKDLRIPKLPDLDNQRAIGQVYFYQLKLESLKIHVAKIETQIMFNKLREENDKWAN